MHGLKIEEVLDRGGSVQRGQAWTAEFTRELEISSMVGAHTGVVYMLALGTRERRKRGGIGRVSHQEDACVVRDG
jgi:hypothetical protein